MVGIYMNKGLFNESGYRNYFIIFGVLIIFIIFLIYLFVSNISKGYIIINEACILEKKGSKYVQINKLNNDVLNGKFNVYNESDLTKNVTIKYEGNSWYYFNDDYSDLNYNKVSLAYSDSIKNVKQAEYDVSYYDDSDDRYLKDFDESVRKNLIKSSYDLDGDGKLETIYTVINGNKSAIFLVRDNSFVNYLDDSGKVYYVQNIVDLDDDGKYEVVVSKGTEDVATFDTCFQIYSIVGNNIKKIKDC